MHFNRYVITTAAAIALLGLSACSADNDSTANNTGKAKPAAEIKAPAGQYVLDRNHTSLAFSISHLGLSNYVVRFAKHDASIELDPDNLSNSSITVTVDPTSVQTHYAGDYKATHKDSKFQSWSEDLAQSEKFFNASKYPEIKFVSTKVKQTGPGQVRVTGDLTLLGQTHPITLDAQVVGSTENHPAYEDVAGAIGFSATGQFKRSTFGMDYLLQPPLLGDTVTVNFDGEFQQAR